MLKIGEPAPDFEGMSTQGRPIRLLAYRGRPVVIYFYPGAFTPLCTRETRRFRDAYPDIQALGGEVIGISGDRLRKQCDFAKQLAVSFPLIADEGKVICRLYKVTWPIFGRVQRITFLIDSEGILRGTFAHEFQVSRHLDDTLRALRQLTKTALPSTKPRG